MKKTMFLGVVFAGLLAFGGDVDTLEAGLRSAILEKVNAVNPIDSTTGQRKYISFGFISDIHKCKRVPGDDDPVNPVTDYWYGSAGILTEAEQSIRLLGSVAADAGLDAIINGGDLSTAPVMGPAKELTEVEYTNEIWNVKAMFDQHVPSSVPLFTVDGNHERNYGNNMHMTDDAWAYVLTNFNTSASVAHAQGVDVTYHRDLANATLGNSQKGRFTGNSYHLDFRRLYETKGVNVRIACLSAYDNASGSDLRNRVFDAAQFYDADGNQLSSGMTPENTVMGMIAHGAEEKVGVSARSAAGTMQCGYMNSYSNPSSKSGPWNGGSHKGLGFFGLVAAHYHFVTTKEITDAFDNLVNADNKVYASVVSVASAHAKNWPAKPSEHQLGTEAAYHFSIFVIDTDHNLMREVRLGGWTSNPVVHEQPVVQLHDFNIRTQLGATNPPEEEEDPPEEEPGDDDDDPIVPPPAAADDLSNYKWAVIGDSLSDPKLENTTDGPFKYYHYLQQTSGIKCVYTNAVGGTGYKNGYNKATDKLADGGCFYQRLEAHPIPSDVDVVTFFGSINDGGFAETDEDLGTATDALPEKSTLAAYMNKAIDLARTQAPNAKIVLIGGIFFDASHATGHVRLNDMLRQIAAARKLNGDANIVSYDWLTEDPDDPLDFHQITVNLSEEGCFASLYTYDWKTRGRINESFGHPNPLYNEIWLAPHFGEVLTAVLTGSSGDDPVTPPDNPPEEPEEPSDDPEDAIKPSGDASGLTDAQIVQAALDAAVSTKGTVTLGKGLFMVKTQLNVAGGVTLVGQDWANTVIKYVGPKDTTGKSRVAAVSDGSVLSHVAITGGKINKQYEHGGGIQVSGTGGTISWCCVTNNAVFCGNTCGGGIGITSTGSVKIDHTIVSGNSVEATSATYGGGGIGTRPGGNLSLEIDTCLVSDNTAGTSGCASRGAGICIVNKKLGDESATDLEKVTTAIRNTTIANNVSVGSGMGAASTHRRRKRRS